MDTSGEQRIIAYDSGEKIILVNRETNQSCSFTENEGSYMLNNTKTEDSIIANRVSEEEIRNYFHLLNFMDNLLSIKVPKKIIMKFYDVYNYLYDSIYGKDKIPEDVENYESYYLHIQTYKNKKHL